MDISKIKIKLDFDTKSISNMLDIMLLVREDLQTQLPFGIFSSSRFQHLFPITESSMSRNKFGEFLITDFLRIFDAACIKHCLEGLKVRVPPNEIIR